MPEHPIFIFSRVSTNWAHIPGVDPVLLDIQMVLVMLYRNFGREPMQDLDRELMTFTVFPVDLSVILKRRDDT